MMLATATVMPGVHSGRRELSRGTALVLALALLLLL